MELKFPLVVGNYAIEVGKSVTDETLTSILYKLVNTESGVVEAETSSLPRALIMVKASNAALGRLFSSEEESDIIWAEDVMNAGEQGIDHSEYTDPV